MASLRRDYPEFKALNTEIIVFGPEKESEFSDYWEKHKMPFPGIADPQHTTANLYGQQVKPLKLGRMPALFVVDKQGLIRFKHFGQSMSDIPTDSSVLEMIKKLENPTEG
jgi:peroxiredoxin